ncbi:MAG TPA: hypothetical protein VHE59_08260 [Mucilaginibacter sp.]|nr:hypothetical protein [Mucilaginibacter sp.]
MQEFNVLWFEDNFKDFDDTIDLLQSHSSKNNRLFKFDQYDHYPVDFDVKLFDGHYSLALIDLNLQNGQKGIEIIKTIRKHGAYIDILLYSNNPTELVQLTEGRNFVEGIFRHATYKGLSQKMCDVVDQVIYKEVMATNRYDLYNSSK